MAFVAGLPVTSGSSVSLKKSASCKISEKTFFGASVQRAEPKEGQTATFVYAAPQMVATPPKPAKQFDMLRDGVKKPASETLLTPRFYTTDFEELANFKMEANLDEIQAINQEFRTDYNKEHFVRDADFDKNWDSIDGETRQLFVEFLERSCTAEFSGFLLYKEIARRLKTRNPVLAEGFELMSRDEARHAGFLNKALGDFNMQLDLGFLTKNRSYTFFKPKYILYATYLSEKIGYWRYITIFRHLEKNPEHRIYPIFKFFDNWCQDENRHGDFMDALLRANSDMITDSASRWWSRFFLLSVFATMFLNDTQRFGFYASIGLDAREYDIEVIRRTNKSAGKLFPCILNVDHPEFFKIMDVAAAANKKAVEIGGEEIPSALKKLKQAPHVATIASCMARLFFMKPIDTMSTWGTMIA